MNGRRGSSARGEFEAGRRAETNKSRSRTIRVGVLERSSVKFVEKRHEPGHLALILFASTWRFARTHGVRIGNGAVASPRTSFGRRGIASNSRDSLRVSKHHHRCDTPGGRMDLHRLRSRVRLIARTAAAARRQLGPTACALVMRSQHNAFSHTIPGGTAEPSLAVAGMTQRRTVAACRSSRCRTRGCARSVERPNRHTSKASRPTAPRSGCTSTVLTRRRMPIRGVIDFHPVIEASCDLARLVTVFL